MAHMPPSPDVRPPSTQHLLRRRLGPSPAAAGGGPGQRPAPVRAWSRRWTASPRAPPGLQETASRQQRSLVPMATGPALLFPGKQNPQRRGCHSNVYGLPRPLGRQPRGAAGHLGRRSQVSCRLWGWCTDAGPGPARDSPGRQAPAFSESCPPTRDELSLQRAWPRGCHRRAVPTGAGQRDPGQWGARPPATLLGGGPEGTLGGCVERPHLPRSPLEGSRGQHEPAYTRVHAHTRAAGAQERRLRGD